jgi:hypothetical protein
MCELCASKLRIHTWNNVHNTIFAQSKKIVGIITMRRPIKSVRLKALSKLLYFSHHSNECLSTLKNSNDNFQSIA